MGNCKSTELTEENLVTYEKRILAYSEVPYESFDIKCVVIDDQGNYIRTF